MPANSPAPNTDPPKSNEAAAREPLYSEYANDPDMLELVEMFVNEMPDRVSSIEQAIRQADIENLARLSHQLKGAAGGYGFTSITEAAAVVEKLAKAEKDLQEIEGSIAELLTLCRRAKA